FNVITKSGGNQVHGDVFGYFTPSGAVRDVKNFPFTGSAANGFSEKDIGGDIGGPIVKNKLWYFGAVNPQWRTNNYLTQAVHTPGKNDVNIPFYPGKITLGLNPNPPFTFATYADFTKGDGFLATAALNNVSGFGSDPTGFQGKQETGGHNYSFRMNSAFTPHFLAEFYGGLHFQRNNITPVADSLSVPLIQDNFAVLASDNTIVPVTHTGFYSSANATANNGGPKTDFIHYIDGRGGSLQRTFQQGPGFGLYPHSDRNRYEFAAHLQSIFSKHGLKYGFEWSRNIYNTISTSSGSPLAYGNPNNYTVATADSL